MIRGRMVTVLTPNQTGVDRLKNPVYGEPIPTTVDNVLIVPGATTDLEETRPDGVTVALTLHFPKTYSGDLRGCSVVLDGEYAGTYHVIGEAHPYPKENCPDKNPWYMAVEVEACHG